MLCECCLASIKDSWVQSIESNGWNSKYYKLCLKKMHIWIGTRTDLIFLIIPCLLPGGATHSWVYSSWLHCEENQKFELSCVWGGGERTQSPFRKWTFFYSICERVTSCLSCPLGINELVWASFLRTFGPEFTVLMFRNMTLPAKGWALGIWCVGYAISPLLFLQKRQYVLKISIKTAISWFSFFTLLMTI